MFLNLGQFQHVLDLFFKILDSLLHSLYLQSGSLVIRIVLHMFL